MTTPGGASLSAGIVGSLGVKIFPELGQFGEQLTAGIVNATTARAVFIGQAMEELGRKVFTRFTVPLAVATAANIAQFQALDREIRTVLTLFGTAPSLIQTTFDEMRVGITGVSKDIGGLEKDIADGLYQAISAGVPRGGVFDFLDVAQMAAIADKTADLTTAVDGLTTVVNAFGLVASDVEEVSDVMFTTVALGKTTFGELSQSIGRVAPIAASAGVSFQELFAIIGATTLQGLKTSEAISFLRAGITGLLRPTDELREIFEDVGFASAEAAIPVIGLQAAFQTVVDAAGGSTSKLQELIGTSEGVGVILGVTGENAKTFERILKGVEQSAGATSAAFDIMDQSVGRSFGRMTESFDRLGNTLGELGSSIVVPFVELATQTVSDLADGFRDLLPLARNLGGIIENLFKVFEIPIIREVVRAFASLVLTSFALIGVFGGLLFGVGKMVKRFALLVFQFQVFKKLRGPVTASGKAMQAWGEKTEKASKAAEGLSKRGARLNTVMGKMGKTIRLVGSGFLTQIGSMLAITVAIGILFNLYSRWKDHQEELTRSTQIFTTQLDILSENVGLVNNAVSFEGLKQGEANLRSFANENIEMVRVLKETKDLLGEDALRSQILAIGAELVWRGNTPEEALKVVRDLAAVTGIKINVDLDLSDPGDLVNLATPGLLVTAQLVADAASEAVVMTGKQTVRKISAEVQGSVDDLASQSADTLGAAFESGDALSVLATIKEIGEVLEDDEELSNEFFKSLLKSFGEVSGADLEVSFFDVTQTDFDEFLQRLEDAPDFPLGEKLRINELNAELDELAEKQISRRLLEGTKELAVAIEEVLPPEQQEKLDGLLDNLADSLAAGRELILAELDRISQGFLDQIPVFDIYEGASDIDFDKWSASQKLVVEDMEAIGDFIGSEKFQRLPEQIQDIFNDASIDDQAWLAALDPDEFNEAVGLLIASVDASKTLGDIAGSEQIGEFVQQVNQDLIDQWGVMAINAANAGEDVEAAFGTELSAATENWPGIVAGALQQINNVITGWTFPKPGAIQGPDIVPGSVQFPPGGTYNYTFIESVEGDDAAEKMEAAALVNATRNLTK